MQDLGEYKFFLGIAVDRNERTSSIRLLQRAYLKGIIEKFGLENANVVATLYVSKRR